MMLKYLNTDITFQEFPDEVALCINITNCPCHCKGCHSPYLADNIGKSLTEEAIDDFMLKYQNEITLIGFMGGDSNPFEIERLSKYIKSKYDILIGWYSGRQEIPRNFDISYFDYIKLGPYIDELGSLRSPKSNQIFYSISNGIMIDCTKKFKE